MRTEQLNYAIAVAQTGSFSKAAEQFFIKQQSLRSSIISLEKELGVTLFVRTPKGTILTPEGQRCLKQFEEILRIYESLRHPAIFSRNLRLGVNDYGSDYVAGILNTFYEIYPNLQISLVEDDSPITLIRLLSNRKIDFAITTIAENILYENSVLNTNITKDIIFQPISKIPSGVFVHKEHPFSNLKNIEMKQLKGWTIISFNYRYVQDYINKIIYPEHIENMIVSKNIEIHRSHIYYKQGISLAVQGDFLTDPNIIFIPFKENIPVIFGVFYHKNISSELKKYCDLIIQHQF